MTYGSAVDIATPLRPFDANRPFRFAGPAPMATHEPIGKLLETIREVCQRGAGYLDAQDAKRHVYLMDRFAARAVKGDMEKFSDSPVLTTVSGQAIVKLPRLLENWVLGYCRKGGSRLLPHFALDTARFVLKMAWGCAGSTGAWEIEPLVAGTITYPAAFGAYFKRQFTSCTGGEFLAVVPAGYRLCLTHNGKVLLEEGTVLRFLSLHCHLSFSQKKSPMLRIVSSQEAKPNSSHEFELAGEILSWAPSMGKKEHLFASEVGFNLPASWITHEVMRVTSTITSLEAVPTWEPGFEDRCPAADTTRPRSLEPVHRARASRKPPRERPQAGNSFPSSRFRKRISAPQRRPPRVRRVPADPVCAGCGTRLKPSMLVWPVERRFCRACKREQSSHGSRRPYCHSLDPQPDLPC